MRNNLLPKILIILGQTATGKSALAVRLAKKFNGEIISADSRQVYRGLNIGTGKITKREMHGIPHHLLDVANPKSTYNVAKFKQDAYKAIEGILKRGKLPIICGGTGFYIQAIVDNTILPDVVANKKLRERLAKIPTEKLLVMLRELDSNRAAEIDPQNRVRIIRSIEIATALGKVPKISSNPIYDSILIGITLPDIELRKKIHIRLLARMKQGMAAEASKLHKNGLSWKRMNELGLEYRFLAAFLQGKSSKEEMLRTLEIEIWHFARRQKTWFKRNKKGNKKIAWFGPRDFSALIKKLNPALLPK